MVVRDGGDHVSAAGSPAFPNKVRQSVFDTPGDESFGYGVADHGVFSVNVGAVDTVDEPCGRSDSGTGRETVAQRVERADGADLAVISADKQPLAAVHDALKGGKFRSGGRSSR
ncbi:hypothetical protein [Nocardia fluminea]|uniref:hypothetical protein n=1 Tax=Nocardia fluminea TaxID=134984 RepID=UPI003D13EB9A